MLYEATEVIKECMRALNGGVMQSKNDNVSVKFPPKPHGLELDSFLSVLGREESYAAEHKVCRSPFF
jgi:hypothetical protein